MHCRTCEVCFLMQKREKELGKALTLKMRLYSRFQRGTFSSTASKFVIVVLFTAGDKKIAHELAMILSLRSENRFVLRLRVAL